jgi:dihydrodipicolinate synthase/N-acetylneuraminate lyase
MLALSARSRQFGRPPSLSFTSGTEQMPTKFRGVMQSPVTPFKDDFSLDLPTFERLDFHVRTGATAISWPHHKGESLNLTIAERKLFAQAAVRVVNGRIPVTIHVSALAVEDTLITEQYLPGAK